MRCLFTMISGLLGLAFLIAGGVLLYTVFIDTPKDVTQTLGGASEVASQVIDASAELDVVVEGSTVRSADVSEISDLNIAPADSTSEINTLDVDRTAVNLQANEVVTEDAVLNTDTLVNPVLQNEVIASDTEVNVIEVDTNNVETAEPIKIEARVVELEWPDTFREGETGAVRITLRALEDGGLEAVAEVDSNSVVATPVLVNDRYDTHNASVTARISAPDFDIEAVTSQQQQMTRGDAVEWRWNLTPNETGNFVISFGVEVVWTPKADSPDQTTYGPKPLWGQAVQTQVDQVFGLISIPTASTAGTILALLGAFLELPFVMDILSNIVQNKMEDANDKRRNRRGTA